MEYGRPKESNPDYERLSILAREMSSKALEALRSDCHKIAHAEERERVEARIEYEINLRKGQGEM